MLKYFNSLLIDKVQCVSSRNILPEFFPAHCTCMNFFLAQWSCAIIFFYAYALAKYFFQNHPTPPPPPLPMPLRNKMVGPFVTPVVRTNMSLLLTTFF